ncbi:MAG: hypothetical protein V1799_12860 [bacterium]
MKQTILLWVLAFTITAASAIYQRMTGPTHPLSGSFDLAGKTYSFKFDRSHGGTTNAPVQIKTDDESIQGTVFWKRYKTDDEWVSIQMTYANGTLSAELPNQPPAGKLLYRVELKKDEQTVSVPAGEPIIIRYKGDVPLYVLIPHVFAMFGAMFLSTRAGLEIFRKEPQYKKFIYWTLGFLFAGGFILGPIMQWYAFNAWWTGWPLGTDLTDNKTAAAFLGWVVAAIALAKSSRPKYWVLGASIVMLVVYLIPHSVLGSELNYKDLEKQQQQKSQPQ